MSSRPDYETEEAAHCVSARLRLEQTFAPEVLTALDEHIRDLAGECLEERTLRDTERDWYSLAEAAQLLGCSYDALRMRARRGRLDVRRQGRTVLVSGQSLRLR